MSRKLHLEGEYLFTFYTHFFRSASAVSLSLSGLLSFSLRVSADKFFGGGFQSTQKREERERREREGGASGGERRVHVSLGQCEDADTRDGCFRQRDR